MSCNGIILGINAFHGDSSAALVVDGKLVNAVEEERFRRMKHWAGLPTEAVRYCLAAGGIRIEDVDHIAVSRDPRAHLFKKGLYALTHRFRIGYLADRLRNLGKVSGLKAMLAVACGVDEGKIRAKVHGVEHHRAHLASAFLVCPFERAAVLSVDGLGDFTSTMSAHGIGNGLKVLESTCFPHSLGFFYTALTQYIGFPKYGDEFKVMGLASYGKPEYLDAMRKIVRLDRNGRVLLGLEYFLHHRGGVSMTWDGGEPVLERMFSDEVARLLGPAREPGSEITKRHENLASSLQAAFEEIYMGLLNRVHEQTGEKAVALAGGCAMNSVANGKIFSKTAFKDIYIQPAAGDAGTAIGAAFYVWNVLLGQPRSFVMDSAYWGPEYTGSDIETALTAVQAGGKHSVRKIDDEDELCCATAKLIADGNVIGWFQGRMEWGARALGNRSILVDPRRAEMKDVLNARIKRREPFRPFAPSILAEAVGNYFEISYPDPFMVKVYPVRPEKRDVIPAVTHVDGSGRLQSVHRETNPRYWNLIKAFGDLTGVPVVLNTSFNENEPIVCTPKEALDCFLRTKMDVIVLGNHVVAKTPG